MVAPAAKAAADAACPLGKDDVQGLRWIRRANDGPLRIRPSPTDQRFDHRVGDETGGTERGHAAQPGPPAALAGEHTDRGDAHPQQPVVGGLGQQSQGLVDRLGDRGDRGNDHRVGNLVGGTHCSDITARIPPLSAGSAGVPGRALAIRAEEGRTVHEGIPTDRRAAARTRPVLLAVRVQRAVEVAGLAVDVDVQRIERCPADMKGRRSSPRWPPSSTRSAAARVSRAVGRA